MIHHSSRNIHPNNSVKDTSSSIVSRNSLLFPSTPHHHHSNSTSYMKRPIYKTLHTISESNSFLNNYLTPISQYEYTQKQSNASPNIGTLSLIRAKLYARASCDMNSNSHSNILTDKTLHSGGGVKQVRRFPLQSINPDMKRIRMGIFYESKDIPDYMKVYDEKGVDDMNKRIADKGENIELISKFNKWITVTPRRRNRRYILEMNGNTRHSNQSSVSKVAPHWMHVTPKTKAINSFKTVHNVQRFRGRPKMKYLVDINQQTALPSFLMDSHLRTDHFS